jgi:hypothetical protein
VPRPLSPTFLAQLASSGACAPILFAELAFANETLYLYGGVGSLTFAGPAYSPASTFPYGQAWTGLGWLGKISAVPQTTKIQAQNVTLSLSGIPSALVLEAVGQVRIAGTATVWLGFFNTSTGALISDPSPVFFGSLDVPTLTDSGETCEISITCENSLLSLNLAPNRRFNDADQQIYRPGDLGFSFVEALANINLFWPQPAPNLTSAYPNFLVMSPQGGDIPVGGTLQITVTMTYSDGSTYAEPGGGSGARFTNLLASTNPAIATIDASTGIVTGVSVGECSIMSRVTLYTSGSPTYAGGDIQMGMYRAACGILVHN